MTILKLIDEYLFLAVLIFLILLMLKLLLTPRLKPDNDSILLFEEKYASGHSMKSLLTRIGGFGSVLLVQLYDKELIIQLRGIFRILGKNSNLYHKIPMSSIKSVKPDKRSISIDLNDGLCLNLKLARNCEFVKLIRKNIKNCH
ncbi:MAG: hypothetical protein PHS44_00190 [Candidatus Dojkabacteria bacterium]|jgi:hypothetical protein|nr:hypothetical protein [Candidatus Dojkabacteria bacterium]